MIDGKRALLLSDLDTGVVLRGIDVSTSMPVELRSGGIDLVYLIATQCAACRANFPLLRRLHQQGQRIVVISGADTPASMRRYALEHNLPFLMLARSSGPLFKVLHRGPTPTTLRLVDGQVREMHIGNLSRAYPSSD